MNSKRSSDVPAVRPESPNPTALLRPAHLRPTRANRAHSARWLGPGLIMAASGIGASDIISATVGGATYGVTLLWALALGVRYTDFEMLLANGDIVSLHLPLTPATRHLLHVATFARMKPGAYLLNTSRGKLVDTTALIEALKSGRLGGVALDVYEEEEDIFFEDHSGEILQADELSRLLTFPNVLITAHQAFLTYEALSEIARVTTANLVRLAEGQPFPEESILVDLPAPSQARSL